MVKIYVNVLAGHGGEPQMCLCSSPAFPTIRTIVKNTVKIKLVKHSDFYMSMIESK